MKRWLIILGLLVSGLAAGATPVLANTSAEVTVTAAGYICEAPGGFTLIYISDYEVGISWTKGADAEKTMVRAAYGRAPEDITDGYEVYHGTGTNCTDTALSLATPEVIYYTGWSQNAGGVWGTLFTSGDTGGFMSLSYLFLTLIILGLGLFLAAFRWKDTLLSWAAALTWLAIGFWWVLGDITNLGLGDTWVQILAFVPFMLFFTVVLRLMNTEIRYEAGGKSWTEWDKKPTTGLSNYEAYKEELLKRTRRR